MPLTSIALVLCLPLLAAAMAQSRPDFSGKWTSVRTTADEPLVTITIAQNAETLAMDSPSPWGMLRYVYKLDGSESKNVTVQGSPPREVTNISSAAWDGASLVIRTAGKSNSQGPFTIQSTLSLDGDTLMLRTTQISETTRTVLQEIKTKYKRKAG
jgi:hypothetical protein